MLIAVQLCFAQWTLRCDSVTPSLATRTTVDGVQQSFTGGKHDINSHLSAVASDHPPLGPTESTSDRQARNPDPARGSDPCTLATPPLAESFHVITKHNRKVFLNQDTLSGDFICTPIHGPARIGALRGPWKASLSLASSAGCLTPCSYSASRGWCSSAVCARSLVLSSLLVIANKGAEGETASKAPLDQ